MSYSIDSLTADCYPGTSCLALIDADELMVATIQAAGGVEDSLRTIFRRAITDT